MIQANAVAWALGNIYIYIYIYRERDNISIINLTPRSQKPIVLNTHRKPLVVIKQCFNCLLMDCLQCV